MAVAFRDREELEKRGCAAFLRVLRTGPAQDATFVGALLLVNAYGEPVEFVHNRMGLPETSLCSPRRLPSYAARALVTSLFAAARRSPLFLCYLESEIEAELFLRRLQVDLPLCSVPRLEGTQGESRPAFVLWVNGPPAAGTPASALLAQLERLDLFQDPLRRAAEGIRALSGGVEAMDVVG